MERKQFTFYRSFWESVKRLSKNDRLSILETIIVYALDGEMPNALSPRQEAVFLLISPVLETARRKAIRSIDGTMNEATFAEEINNILARRCEEDGKEIEFDKE